MANLHAAYVANDNTDQLLVTSLVDGKSWSADAVTHHFSRHALAMTSFRINGSSTTNLYMAYVARNSNPLPPDGQLLVIRSGDGKSWSSDFVTNHRAPFGPAIANFGGQLRIAYVADDSSRQLLVTSSSDGEHWSSGDAVTPHSSKAAPALASFNGKLWMAYVANDSSNQLLVISSSDGVQWSGDFVTHHRSSLAPTLAVHNGQLWMTYIADDNTEQLLNIFSVDGEHWSGDFVSHHSSKAAPALARLWSCVLQLDLQ